MGRGHTSAGRLEDLAVVELDGSEPHGEEARDGVAASSRRVRYDHDLLAQPLHSAHRLDRTGVRRTAIVYDAKLVEEERVVLFSGREKGAERRPPRSAAARRRGAPCQGERSDAEPGEDGHPDGAQSVNSVRRGTAHDAMLP